MSLDDIIAALEEDVAVRCREIMDRGQEEARQILDRARLESLEAESALDEERARRVKVQEDRIIRQAEFERDGLLARARETLISEVLGETRVRLAQAAKSPEYEAIFARLVAEAMEAGEGLGSDKVLIVNRGDKELAVETLRDLDCVAEVVVENIGAGGGAILASPDRRRRLLNTLESRLDKAAPHMKADVMRVLFET